MPITLEAPADDHADLLTGQTSFVHDEAETAADLIDQGGQEAEPEPEPIGDVLNAGMSPAQIAEQCRKDGPADIPLDTNEPTGGVADCGPGSTTFAFHIAALQRKEHIAALEDEYIEIALEMAQTETEIEIAKDRLKELKEQFAHASEELVRARTKQEFQPRLKMGSGEGERPAQQVAAHNPTTSDSAPAAAPDSPANSDAWKAAPLADLNLPAKLAEKLREASVETIGQLESLRAEISQAKAVWPKGIGQAKITIIEDAVVNWLAKWHAKQPAEAESSTSVVGPQPVESEAGLDTQSTPQGTSPEAPPPADPPADKPKKERKPRAKKEPATSTAKPAPKPPGNASPHKDNGHASAAQSDSTDAELAAAVRQRAAEINDGSPGCLDAKMPKPTIKWDSGHEAFGRGLELIECPYTPGPEQDDWIRGFLAAHVLSRFESGPEVSPAAAVAAEPPAAARMTMPAGTVSLDDI